MAPNNGATPLEVWIATLLGAVAAFGGVCVLAWTTHFAMDPIPEGKGHLMTAAVLAIVISVAAISQQVCPIMLEFLTVNSPNHVPILEGGAANILSMDIAIAATATVLGLGVSAARAGYPLIRR